MTEAKRTRQTSPVINYGELEVETTEDRPSSGTELVLSTPLPGWLAESRENKENKRVRVPDAAVDQTKYLLRRAAILAGHGVGIRVTDNGDGTSYVVFWGKDKRVNKAKAESAPESAPKPSARSSRKR